MHIETVRNHIKILVLPILVLAFLGCSQAEPLTPLDQVTIQSVSQKDVKVSFCTDPAFDQKQYLKTIIILDHSGSNKKNYLMNTTGDGGPAIVGGTIQISTTLATDPTGTTRYGTTATNGTLLNYLSTLPANNPADPTHFFALVDFNDTATTYPTGSSGFTADTKDFYNYVLTDSGQPMSSPNDAGATSYLSALSAANNIVTNDISNAKKCAALAPGSPSPGAWCLFPGKAVASSYVIVFMSDGSPITSISGVGVDGSGNIVLTGGPVSVLKEPSDAILGQVGALASLSSDSKYVTSVNFFTIYYYFPGNVDLAGQKLLADMAKIGNGIAYNALSGSNINYSQFQPPTKRIKYQFSDIFVTNASTTWWTDGKLHLDTDMDGLPDDVELAWGSDPLKHDTDGNGVSDLVEYQASKQRACKTLDAKGICQDPAINYAATLCSGLPTKRVGGLLQYFSSDPDGLNDCEKRVLNDGGGVGNPDSNSDLIPDWLEFKNGIAFQAGTTPGVSSTNQDGYSIYQKIKYSMPLAVPAQQILNLQKANYSVLLVSTNISQDCYSVTVTDLPFIGEGNTIRVDIIERSELLQDQYLYKVGKKVFATGAPVVQFNDWNDAAEIAAGTWSIWP